MSNQSRDSAFFVISFVFVEAIFAPWQTTYLKIAPCRTDSILSYINRPRVLSLESAVLGHQRSGFDLSASARFEARIEDFAARR